MKKAVPAVVLLFLSILVMPLRDAGSQARAQDKPAPKIKVGDKAPDFTLLAFDGAQVKPVSLKDYLGKKNVVLAFYVFAFTGG